MVCDKVTEDMVGGEVGKDMACDRGKWGINTDKVERVDPFDEPESVGSCDEVKKGILGDRPCYHNDYAPRYGEGFNIYDKAREHMRRVKKGENQKSEK